MKTSSDHASVAMSNDSGHGARYKIVLVEDSESLAHVYSHYLKDEPVDLVRFGTGKEALAYLDSNLPDVLLLDLKLPDIDGMELLRVVKNKQVRCPVVVITGHGSVDVAVESMRMGAAAFLEKPFERQQLIVEVRKTLNRSRLSEMPSQILDTCPQAVIIADESGKVLHVNQASVDLFGFSFDEFVQRRLSETIVPPEHREAHEAGLARHRARRSTTIMNSSVRITALAKSGEILPIEILLTEYVDASHTLIVGYIRDLRPDIAREELRLKAERHDELEKAIYMQEQFCANINHELRTPLNTILGIAQGFERGIYGALTQTQKTELAAIKGAGEHLLALVNDILDLAKTGAAGFELRKEPCAVSELLSETLTLAGPTPTVAARIEISNTVGSSQLDCDPTRMKQALLNLLGNAKKFAEAGSLIELNASLVDSGEGIQFVVKNRGPVLTDEMREKVFKPFVQVDPTASREHEGHGLGLSIVRQIAELHGGSAFIAPGITDGVEACIKIPWTSGIEQEVSSETASRVPRIMLVDDRVSSLRFVVKFVTSLGYNVSPIETGAQALQELEQDKFDLILLDIQMPGMDGFELLKRIRTHSDPSIRRLPVVMVSGGHWDREQCKARGAQDFVPKPIDFDVLEAAIRDHVVPISIDRIT